MHCQYNGWWYYFWMSSIIILPLTFFAIYLHMKKMGAHSSLFHLRPGADSAPIYNIYKYIFIDLYSGSLMVLHSL